ncbi:MAG: FkbM family methyltransferase [Rhodospirillaceae bacterium]
MVTPVLKRIAAQMPPAMQHELRRMFFHAQIRGHRFTTDEKEYGLLDTLIARGDWVLDIGANVGHYTMRMAELVGPEGRVIAIEPVPDTFSLLAANVRLFAHRNVTLLNIAASDRTAIVGMTIPDFPEGLANYYQARVVSDAAALATLTMPVDAFQLPHRVALAKIDVEGHESAVLRGMRGLIARDRPALILETSSRDVLHCLDDMGYSVQRLPGSSNVVCTHRGGVVIPERIDENTQGIASGGAHD